MTLGLLRQEGNVWFLSPNALYRERLPSIDWNGLLPPTSGKKKSSKQLVLSAQGYMLARFYSNSHAFNAKTVTDEYSTLKRFVRWMIARKIWSFSQIRPHDLINFLREKPRSRTNNPISISTIHNYTAFFQRLWEFRDQYPNPIIIDANTILDEIHSHIKTRSKEPWKSIEDTAAYSLIKESIDWIDQHGDFIALFLEDARKNNQNLQDKTSRQAASGKFYYKWSRKPEFEKIENALTKKRTIANTFRLAVELTEGAILFLITITTGLRISELTALDMNCHEYTPNGDGGMRSCITGVAAKKNGLPRKWIAEGPLPRVMALAKRLSPSKRSPNDSKALFTASISGGHAFHKDSTGARRILAQTVNARMHLFVCSGVRRNGTKIKAFHPHMARKTFAQFAVRRDRRNLEAVAAQLGHVYKEFTDGTYVGTNFTLAQMLVQEDRKELERGLRHLLTVNQLAGGAAESIKSLQAATQKFGGKISLQKVINNLISRGVKIAPCNWGFCVYSAPLSACGGDDEGPNETNRSPEICAGCANFATTPIHQAWWNARALREEMFLKSNDIPEQTREIVLRRLAVSRRVLDDLVFKQNGRSAHE